MSMLFGTSTQLFPVCKVVTIFPYSVQLRDLQVKGLRKNEPSMFMIFSYAVGRFKSI